MPLLLAAIRGADTVYSAVQPVQGGAGLMDPIAATLCAELQARAAVGMKKYGVSVSDRPLSRLEWLQHAKEEALDLAVYLQRLIEDEKRTGGSFY